MSSITPYESLIAAATALVGTDILNHDDPPTPHQSLDYLAQNEVSLRAAREALQMRCAVEVRFDVSFLDEHLKDLPAHRLLAKSFALAARLAAADGDFEKAARWCVDNLELSNAVRRGGLVLDFLISTMIVGIAVEDLRKIRCDLDDGTRQWLIGELPRFEADRESLEAIIERDQRWETESGYVEEPFDASSLPDSEDDGLTAEQQAAALQAMEAMANLPDVERHAAHHELDRRYTALLRMLVVDLALREHRSVSGDYPADLAALPRSIIAKVPDDPFVGSAFRYRRTGPDSFLLYSPGPTGIDHGGQFGHWMTVTAGKADYGLDNYDYEAEGECE